MTFSSFLRCSLSTALAAICTVAASAQLLSPYTADASKWAGASVWPLQVEASVELPVGTENDFDLELPTLQGTTTVVRLREYRVFAQAMQARYPSIRTYRGVELKTGYAVAVTQDWEGLHVFVDHPAGSWQIEPISLTSARLATTNTLGDIEPGAAVTCGYDHESQTPAIAAAAKRAAQEPTPESQAKVLGQVEKSVYVLALASTGEFSNRYGGTKTTVNAAFARSINILNAITLSEVDVQFILHPENDTLIFLNPATDPYFTPTLGRSLLGENAEAINTRINVGTYDVGHVFTNGCSDVGGVVSGLACTLNGKARGVTCHYTSLERIVRDVLAHEIAHQFTVSHTFNNCPNSADQRAAGTAFEPGSGSTIMSYQGSCGADNNISRISNDSYYHVGSLQQFMTYVRTGFGASCADRESVANQEPIVTINIPAGLTIPKETPFVLRGSATDPDGDQLFYNWEQYDLGRAVDLCDQSENSPLFRSVPPSINGNVRYLPRYDVVRNNGSDCEEQLPKFGRDLTFRLTARDQRASGGGTVWEQLNMKVAANAGPFRVTSQTSRATTYTSGEFVTVTWDVANTNVAPVNCQRVDILLSTNDGIDFPFVLVANTNNDGSEGVTLPNLESANARIMVRAADNIFYAMSTSRFSIITPTEPGFTFATSETTTFLCLPDTAEIDLFTSSLLGFNTPIALSIEGMFPSGVIPTLGQDTLMPGESTKLTINFNNYTGTDSIFLTVVATADGVPVARRDLIFDAVSNDFSDLLLAGPLNGEEGVAELPTFRFIPSLRANDYIIEVSPDPSFDFGTFVIEDPDPNGSQLGFLLEPNQVYFWRVVPINRCGRHFDTPVNAFATTASSCESFSNNESFIISANRRYTAEVPIVVNKSGTVSEVAVRLVDLRYNSINGIEVSLHSPAGDSAILHRRSCQGGILRAGYDDDSPIASNFCGVLPTNGESRRPVTPLSVFAGEELMGTWRLEIKIVNASGAGGMFNEFKMEFCAAIVSASPQLDLNLVTVPLGGFQYLTPEFIDASDPDNPDDQLHYIIVDTPSRGHLELYGQRLKIGDRWTQAQSQTLGLIYVDDGTAAGLDSMRIVLFDNAGNLIATPKIEFEIDPRHTTGASSDLPQVAMTLAPNPTGNYSRLRFAAPSEGGEVSLIDLQGRQLMRLQVLPGQRDVEIDASTLAAGMYLVDYRGAEGVRTLRLVRQ